MNRLNEIRRNTEIKQWKYIPGDLNQVDMCTCYHLFQYLNSDSIWIRGPDFLYRNEKENAFEYGHDQVYETFFGRIRDIGIRC